ncbi:MAG: glycosyltransferase family 2 protein [Bacteroidota bacterium]
MLTTTLNPHVAAQPTIKDLAVEDVTVVMPFYNRIKFLQHYIAEGFWDGLKLQLVCDGPAQAMLSDLHTLVAPHEHIHVHSYEVNQGPGYARATGIARAETPGVVFCDDDDFMTDGAAFLTRSSQRLNLHPDVLFTAMPDVAAFNEQLAHRIQYDRRQFHGKTGRELLTFLVKTGEMRLLGLGSVFRTSDINGIYPETFFKVSEDYTFLARLCAKYPDRKVYVEERGMYMRLIQQNSLSSKASYSLDKIVMHLVSMFVGAYYLFKMGMLRTAIFQQILRNRGDVLLQSYSKGKEAADMMAALLDGSRKTQLSGEQKAAFDFLQSKKHLLPEEFLWLVGWQPPQVAKRTDWNSI